MARNNHPSMVGSTHKKESKMIPKIKRILYATDLSENARYAFGYAADLAQKYNAQITIISVLESFSPVSENRIKDMMGTEKWEHLKSKYSNTSAEKIKERVSDFCKEMDKKIDSCNLMVDDIRVPKGIPHVQILKTAKDIKADMIVMGTHGHNILQDSLIGNTAKRIVKDSQMPVVIIRLPEKSQ
jgi:nucleotide-binding universal stress UspA family protein